MKRNFKVLMLSLLGALSFAVAGCSDQKPAEQPGGNNTTQPDTQKPDVKPVYKTVYEAAKAQGYAGTEEKWNKEVEDIFAKQDYTTVKFDAVSFATTGDGEPTESLDNNLNLYFNNNSKTVYTRSEGSTAWTEMTNAAKTNEATIAKSEMSFVLFDDNYIRLSLLVVLSNGHTLFINKEITVADVSLSTTELDMATTFDQNLNVVVTYEFNKNNGQFIVPMTSSIIVKNEIKKEVGIYSVSIKLEGLSYPKTVEVFNSKKTLFEAVQIVGFEGDEKAWGELVTKHSTYIETAFVEELASVGNTAPSDDLDPKINIYIDTFAHKYYSRNPETKKWEDKIEVVKQTTPEANPETTVTLNSVAKGLLTFDDNTYRLVTVYIMSNGYTLCDVENINVSAITLSNNELDIIDPDFDTKLANIKVIIHLDNNVQVLADMNSSIVVLNEVKKEVGAHKVQVKFEGLTYPLTINVIDSTPIPEETPKA